MSGRKGKRDLGRYSRGRQTKLAGAAATTTTAEESFGREAGQSHRDLSNGEVHGSPVPSIGLDAAPCQDTLTLLKQKSQAPKLVACKTGSSALTRFSEPC